MTSGAHVIRCKDTGEALANKLDGGDCVCKPGECEMRKLRNREGDYAKDNSEDEGFDGMGFAIGLATGFPVSPRGFTMGSILGSLLHPTERNAAYDVTAATPTTPAPVTRDVDFNDNSTSAPPIDQPDPPQAAPAYEPPSYTPDLPSAPDPAPSYEPDPPSAPDPAPSYEPDPPSYTPDPAPSYEPDPTPSYDSGSSSYDSGSSSFDSGSSSSGDGS